MTEANRPEEDVVLQAWMRDAQRFIESGVATELIAVCPVALMRICRELQHLREVTTIPLITPESSLSSALCIRVLTEHEKGQPVNAQDLINALMWRVKNQREQLARLNRRVEEYRSDD